MEEKFIQLVLEHPYLYDKGAKDFKNTEKKSITWNQIGTQCGIGGDEAAKYFKSLREKYSRLKREKEKYERSGAGAYYKKEWHLFSLMSFLDEIVRPRKTITNILHQTGPHVEVDDSITSQDLLDHNIVSPVGDQWGVSQDRDENSQMSNVTEPIVMSDNDNERGEPVENMTESLDVVTPSTSMKAVNQVTGNSKPLLGSKRRKAEDQVATVLENIASNLTSKKTFTTEDSVETFCNHLQMEMLQMPAITREEFKDDILELLLKIRKQRRFPNAP